jgi:hypothetical protein
MVYLGLLALRVAAQLFGYFVLVDAGPYRLEGGVTSGFILPLGLIDGGGRKQRQTRCGVWDGKILIRSHDYSRDAESSEPD